MGGREGERGKSEGGRRERKGREREERGKREERRTEGGPVSSEKACNKAKVLYQG